MWQHTNGANANDEQKKRKQFDPKYVAIVINKILKISSRIWVHATILRSCVYELDHDKMWVRWALMAKSSESRVPLYTITLHSTHQMECQFWSKPLKQLSIAFVTHKYGDEINQTELTYVWCMWLFEGETKTNWVIGACPNAEKCPKSPALPTLYGVSAKTNHLASIIR